MTNGMSRRRTSKDRNEKMIMRRRSRGRSRARKIKKVINSVCAAIHPS